MHGVTISLVVLAMVTLSGCASTKNLYAKYDENCDVPGTKIIEKVVEKPVEKIRIVEKPVERIKIVKQIVEKPVEKIKYVDRIKTKYKYKTKYVDRQAKVAGEMWEQAVYFDFDKSNLPATELKRIKVNTALLKKHKSLKVNVQAFADEKGSHQYNKRLSANRLKTVIDYLVSNGVSRARIKASSMGEELPILDGSEFGRSVNRRVEMMLLDKTGRPVKLKMMPLLK